MGAEHDIIAAIQSLYNALGGVADAIFFGLTFLGDEIFNLLIITVIYWCINKKTGEYLIFTLYLSLSINGIIKDIVRRPRPFLTKGCEDLRYVQVENSLLDTVSLKYSYSFPSAHSQVAASVLGGIAVWVRKTWVSVVAAVLILGVMVSRVYLGVHFPTDVIGGAVISLILAVLSYILFQKLYDKKIMLFIGAVTLSAFSLATDFTADTLKTVAFGVGMLIGMTLEDKYIKFTVEGTLPKKVGRVLLGFVIVMALRIGLKAVFPEEMIFDGLRYFILGIAAMYVCPLLFKRLKL